MFDLCCIRTRITERQRNNRTGWGGNFLAVQRGDCDAEWNSVGVSERRGVGTSGMEAMPMDPAQVLRGQVQNKAILLRATPEGALSCITCQSG